MTNQRALGPGTIELDDEIYGTLTLEVGGKRYTVRELSVDEGDEALEGARQPDKSINDTLNTRLLLAKAIVEPATSVAQIGKFGSQKYVAILRAFNTLNTLPEANPTPAGGSPAQTSPDGGAPSPETSDDSPVASTSEWSGSQPTP